jgi:hypothetical protein
MPSRLPLALPAGAQGPGPMARDGLPGVWRKAEAMSAFFRLLAAGPMFFVSAWLLMIFAGIVAGDVGIEPFGYVTSMVVTIGLWLTVAPAIGAVAQARTKTAKKPA